MNYIFFGTPHNSAILLDRLIRANKPPIALVTNPDRPAGRKKTITPPETKRLVLESDLADKIKIFQPEKPADIATDLAALSPDLFVVLAYGRILPPALLSIPRLGTVGVHPSLLPKYRGPSPIQSALLNNDTETGVALYQMGPGLDDGPVLAVQKLPIEQMTHEELSAALANLAADMLIDLMPPLATGEAQAIPQDESLATFTKKFTTADAFIEPADLEVALHGDAAKTKELYGKIRAFNPEPGAWTTRNGKRMKILRARLNGDRLELQTIQYEGGIPEEVGSL